MIETPCPTFEKSTLKKFAHLNKFPFQCSRDNLTFSEKFDLPEEWHLVYYNFQELRGFGPKNRRKLEMQFPLDPILHWLYKTDKR